ncbi:MAG TPA: aminomethyl-transferring glycine dehydrogenase subunit GcvPA [Clostridiales bacterium]|nr:aminomethyl-transferring glycine dehydrogenase subunit GcvPA [Clostridiales bacterium]
MGTYVPNTREEQQEMLREIGVHDLQELFHAIPREVCLDGPLKLPSGLPELSVYRKMSGLAGRNKVFQSIFRGAGAYRHYIPSIVKQITSKEEFVTAYTPYQAEISQGILQSIFEYQTMICELTGMDVSNASVYDGATAAAEAVIMCKERKRTKALVSETVHPETIQTIQTYCSGTDMEVILVPAKEGHTDMEALQQLLDEETASVLLQQPNYYGILEDAEPAGILTHEKDAKFIMACNPISLGLLKAPSEYGADIAVGEGQPLGIPLSYGGPYLGFMASTEKLMRRLPGRIVGETKDTRGERAFVLTLQAREQHIRREKASSNICSNQALCAMTAAVYLDAMGARGLRQAAESSMSKAHYLAGELCKLPGFALVYPGEFFHEFVTTCRGNVDKVLRALEDRGILGGYPLSGKDAGHLLWCATEMNTKEEMDTLVSILEEVTRA